MCTEHLGQVENVVPHQTEPNLPLTHHVTLECLDDDRLGETLDVIWERELHAEIRLPAPERWDAADPFQAFLRAILVGRQI